MKKFKVRGKEFESPVFLPDATKGFIRCISSEDLKKTKIEGVVVNTYHIFNDNILPEIHKKKGIHNYMDFNGLIISDSGGFQAMSLIRDNPQWGHIDDEKVVFNINNKKVELTPELCIKIQILIGADIIMCLDDCTQPNLPIEEQEKSVERTINWARKCKQEFEKQTKGFEENRKPLLLAIIQGGKNLGLRKKCAEELIKIGFDGYAFGGWPVENKEFLYDLLDYTAKLMPNNKLKYAMGVGKPENIAECFKMGYDLFDCVIPTREARNERIYCFKKGLFGYKKPSKKPNFYKHIRIRNLKNKNKNYPLSNKCNLECCTCNTISSIHKLFKQNNPESKRLATIHNLGFFKEITNKLKKSNQKGFQIFP